MTRTADVGGGVVISRSKRVALAFVYEVLLLILIVFATIALMTGPQWSVLIYVQALLCVVLPAVALFASVIRDEFSLAWSVFWTWTLIFMGLAPMYQLGAGKFPWGFSQSAADIETSQFVVIIGCVTVWIVSSVTEHYVERWRLGRLVTTVRPTEDPLIRPILNALMGAYVVSCVVFVVLMGPALFGGKGAFKERLAAVSDVPGSGTLFFFTTAGAIVIPALVIVWRKNGMRLPRVLIAMTAAAAFLVTNPLIGSRFLTGSVLLATFAALLSGHWVLRLLPAGAAVLLVSIFPSLDLLRGDGTGAAQLALTTPGQTLITPDFDAFEMLARVVSLGGQLPQGGPNQFELFVAPLVRWIPVVSDWVQGDVSGPVVAKAIGMGYTNVSMPLWGEAYLVAGILGVVVTFALLGLLHGVIRQETAAIHAGLVLRQRSSVDAPAAALLFIVLRGSLYEVLGYLLFAIATWLVFEIIAERKRRPVIRDESENLARTIAFYLPQFHAIPENDGWWGEGFTEWVNVQRARAQFAGHDQPRRAGELGQYDLSEPGTMHRQAELAAENDIDGFCFYFYWFAGKRLLEKPLDDFLATGPDFPFCISWANENWTRRWDGKANESLIAQEYTQSTAMEVFDDFLPYLRDPRYIKSDGACVIVVHRADHLPDPKSFVETWRRRASELGIGALHIVAAETKPGIDPRPLGFDAICEFPPVGSNTLATAQLAPVKGLNPAFRGRLMSYRRLVTGFLSRDEPRFIRYRAVVPSWDNTARRQEKATVYVGASPSIYARWLSRARQYEDELRGSNGLVFINAWNEWAEGAYLEPDQSHGLAYLDATRTDYVPPDGSTAKVPIGQPSWPWAHSLIFATAGSILQFARKVGRKLKQSRPRLFGRATPGCDG